MTINTETVFKLSSGYEIPAIGFGTYFSASDKAPVDVENAVKLALQSGYRHIDAAAVYENEASVGKGIKASGVPRGEIFVTSKLWNTEHDPKDVGPALDHTLKDLDLDYVDLYLIHWPSSWVKQIPFTFEPTDDHGKIITNNIPIASTWAAMESLATSGKARSIGVSNFSQAQLEQLITTAKIIPAVNQIRAHPYCLEKGLIAWCTSKNIHTTAWGPLTIHRGKSLNVTSPLFPAITEIAKGAGMTPVKLALSWAVQRGTSVIPNSSNAERIVRNFDVTQLSEDIFKRVDELEKKNMPVV